MKDSTRLGARLVAASHDLREICRVDKSSAIVVTALSVLYVLPIVFARNFYVDDAGRVTDAYFWYARAGRPLGALIARLETLSSHNVSIFPYNQIIAAVVVGFFALACINRLFGRSNFSRFQIIAIALLVLVNPFLIDTFLYQFDSLQFAFSISAAMLAFTYYATSQRPSLLVSFGLLMAAALAYFPTTQIYIVFMVLAYALNGHAAICGNYLRRAVSMGLQYVIVAIVSWYLMSHVGDNGYIHHQANFGAPSINNLLPYAWQRLQQLTAFAILPLHKWYGIVWGLVFATGLACFVRNQFVDCSSKGGAALKIVVIFVLLPVAVFGSLLASSPEMYFRARYFVGYGFLILLSVISIYLAAKRGPQWLQGAASCGIGYAMVLCFSLSATLGQGLYFQRDFLQKVAYSISSDLQRLGFDSKKDKLGIHGALREPPTIQNARDSSHFISTLLRHELRQTTWTRAYLNMYGLDIHRYGKNPGSWPKNAKVIGRSGWYTISRTKNEYWVNFQ